MCTCVVARRTVAGWGVCAQWRGAVERGDLIDLNASTFFTPASNTKLYTVAAAQARLGLEAVLSTELWLTKTPQGTAVLTLKGSGDPSLTFAHLETAAAAVAPQLEGNVVDIVVDVSFFGRSAIPDAWDWDYVSTTSGVLPSSVVVDRNTMQLAVSATQPGAPAKLTWEHATADEAVEIDNSVRR
jgi:D-alanyl-D-alanine carboxypeptidase/D-alanyl-D-alanine-endopeptidase (penicillin-binding protein 4)